jgi:hypothetical protein
MEKRRKVTRFLKNRNWRSKVANSLKGRAEDVCQEYLYGALDREQPVHVTNWPKKWLLKSLNFRDIEKAS